MAKIGLRYPVYGIDETGGVIGKAIQADIDIQSNNVKLYADDTVAESDTSFQGGTITLGVDDLTDEVQSVLLGHTVSEDGEMVANKDDSAANVGIGFYGVRSVGGVKKYRAIWLVKVKFAEPTDQNSTQGETITFNTPVIVGNIMTDSDGDWKSEQTFETETEAKTYLEAKANITPGA